MAQRGWGEGEDNSPFSARGPHIIQLSVEETLLLQDGDLTKAAPWIVEDPSLK